MSSVVCSDRNSSVDVPQTSSQGKQKRRIMAAIGNEGNDLPFVDEVTLFRYFEHLSKTLYLPFNAEYPEPSMPSDEGHCRCKVLELLDPSKYVGDPFDGILCKTEKAGIEVILPLIELKVAWDDPNFQLVEDYWYWFWNWRCP